MGREAVCRCHWRDETAEAKVLLESQELILRGAIKARFARETWQNIRCEGDRLTLEAGGDRLVLELGEQAERWRIAMCKPVPSLADKLGLKGRDGAHVFGVIDDAALIGALEGRDVALERACMIVAQVETPAMLDALLDLTQQAADLPLWCILRKGKRSDIDESMIRAFWRAHGYVDTKSCAVSAERSALRFNKKR